MAIAQESRSTTGTLTLADGTQLFTRSWPVEGARASIALSHGYGEHSGRYEHVAERLNAEGYSVYAIDHRSHGRSPGSMGFIASFDQIVDDFGAFYNHLTEALGHTPEFVFGHSMGALVAALWAERSQQALKGLVLSSGALKVGENVSVVTQKISAILSVIAPKAGVLELGTKGLSHDEAVVQAYESDPLVYHGKIQARTGYVMMTAIQEATSNASRVSQPLLLLHGTEDTLAVPDGSRELHAAAGSDDKTLKLYEGGYHEVFNDDRAAEFMQDLVDWLERRS